MKRWVAATYFNGDSGSIVIDYHEGLRYERPPIVYGQVPDLYARRGQDAGVIIGEAKTPRDLENPHTSLQLQAFLRKCAEVPGSLLVVATPWYAERLASSMIVAVQRRFGFESAHAVVLKQLGPRAS